MVTLSWMNVLIIEPLYTPMSQSDIDTLMPNLLRAFGHPPERLIIDQSGSNMGTYLKAWCDKMKLPYETVKMSPFINDLEQSITGHIRGIDKADAVIMFAKSNTVIQDVVVTACGRKKIPLVIYYLQEPGLVR